MKIIIHKLYIIILLFNDTIINFVKSASNFRNCEEYLRSINSNNSCEFESNYLFIYNYFYITTKIFFFKTPCIENFYFDCVCFCAYV